MFEKLAYVSNHEFLTMNSVFLKCAENALDQWYALITKKEKEHQDKLNKIATEERNEYNLK